MGRSVTTNLVKSTEKDTQELIDTRETYKQTEKTKRITLTTS